MVSISAIQKLESRTFAKLSAKNINCLFVDWFPSTDEKYLDSNEYIEKEY